MYTYIYIYHIYIYTMYQQTYRYHAFHTIHRYTCPVAMFDCKRVNPKCTPVLRISSGLNDVSLIICV